MKKNISLIIILVLVVGAIIYLDGMKVHPDAATNSGTPQTIGVTTTSSLTVATGTQTGSKLSAAQITANIQAIATADQKAGYKPAIEIANPTGFINASSNFTLASQVGKNVVLLDFWTYSCINCIRTLPYLTSWYAKYQNEGFNIVGIHTPEFDFEKDIKNVQMAVTQYGIKYPVVLDSNYGTWDAYGNLYWPHEYLIDIAGYIVHDQVGEGNYDETEAEIQKLLAQRAQALGLRAPSAQAITMPDQPNIQAESPETYFGSNRNQYLGDGVQGQTGLQSFSAPSAVAPNTLYLGGSWDIKPEYAQAASVNGASAMIEYQYDAKGIYFVAGTSDGNPVTIQVLQDGNPVPASVAGNDIFYRAGKSYVTVTGNRLYRLIDAPAASSHLIELIIPSSTLQAYTFTFG